MRIISARDYDHMSRQAANIISAQVILKPDCVLGLATGSSPIGTYKQLIEWYKKGDIDFSRVKSVNLDEYVGLDYSSDQSYIYFMRNNFYDEIIRSLGGIDLQLLGLGPNGHIGFNEPDDHFTKGTHKVALTDATIQANKRFFEKEEDVPRFAYTMGICDIMHAERVVMVVSGESKAEIVREAFFGPVTPQVPASILQLHKDFTLVADEAALSKI